MSELTEISELIVQNTTLLTERDALRVQLANEEATSDAIRVQRDAQRRISTRLQQELDQANAAIASMSVAGKVLTVEYDVVFTGAHGPDGPTFVEVEVNGKSVNREWIERADGCSVLRFREVGLQPLTTNSQPADKLTPDSDPTSWLGNAD